MKQEEDEKKKGRLFFGSLENIEKKSVEEQKDEKVKGGALKTDTKIGVKLKTHESKVNDDVVPVELTRGATKVDAEDFFASTSIETRDAIASCPADGAAAAAVAAERGEQSSSSVSSSSSQPESAAALVGGMIDETRREKLEMLAFKRTAITVPAPTLDSEVKAKLRQFGHAVTLFGEGPYERRERLRFLLATTPVDETALTATAAATDARTATTTTTTTTTSTTRGLPITVQRLESLEPELQKSTLFYSEGTHALRAARVFIAEYSIPRALKRLKRERFVQIRRDPLEAEDRCRVHVAKLKSALQVASSQIGEDRPLTAGRFSSDSRFFATASWCPLVKIWNVSDSDLVRTLRGHEGRVHALAWRPSIGCSHADANRRCDSDADDVEMSDAAKATVSTDSHQQQQHPKKKDHSDDHMSPRACDLATGSADGKILLWSSHSSDPVEALSGHEDRINRLAFHPSGRFLASTSHDDSWRLWDISTGQEILLQEGHSQPPYAVAFHTDGSLLVVADLSGNIRIWDLRTGKSILALQGHVKQVLSVDTNPQIPHQIASASDDHTVRIWDLRKQKSTTTILAHTKLVSECMFEPVYGRYLLTASYDCQMKLWATTDWSNFRVLQAHEGRIMGADISPDGSVIGSVGFDRTWKLWKSSTVGSSQGSTRRSSLSGPGYVGSTSNVAFMNDYSYLNELNFGVNHHDAQQHLDGEVGVMTTPPRENIVSEYACADLHEDWLL